MKKILLSLFVLATLLQTFAKAETAMIGVVDGMVCMECQKKVTKKLKAATGQSDVVVSWPDGVAIVNLLKLQILQKKTLKKLLHKQV